MQCFSTPNGSRYVGRSTGSSFLEYEQWDMNFGQGSKNQFVADVDGDGKAAAIVVDLNGNWYIALSTEAGFAPFTQWIRGHGYGSKTSLLPMLMGTTWRMLSCSMQTVIGTWRFLLAALSPLTRNG
jgi:hypothetical protein